MIGRRLLAAIGIASCLASPASAQDPLGDATVVPRFALVIGAQNYDFLPPVPNALNDATVIAGVLGQTFSTVRFLANPKASEIYDFTRELAALSKPDREPAVLVVYFAGHGFQANGFNFVVPTDAHPDKLLTESVPVSSILGDLQVHRAGIAIVLLDACRTSLVGANGAALHGGFASVAAPTNTVLSFAAQFDHAALSVANAGDMNSPYASALKNHVVTPSKSLSSVLDDVRRDVRSATAMNQSPEHLVAAAAGRFFFRPADAERVDDEAHWKAARLTERQRCIIEYLDAFPDGRFLYSAIRWLDNPPLRGAETALDCPR